MEQGEVAVYGLADLTHRRAPLPQRVLLEHQRDAERGEDGRQRVASDQGPERRDLERGAQHGDDDRRHEQGQPVVPGHAQHAGAHERAQHEQIAVGEVDDVHDPEDEGETRGDHGQHHPVDQSVERLDEDLIHER